MTRKNQPAVSSVLTSHSLFQGIFKSSSSGRPVHQ